MYPNPLCRADLTLSLSSCFPLLFLEFFLKSTPLINPFLRIFTSGPTSRDAGMRHYTTCSQKRGLQVSIHVFPWCSFFVFVCLSDSWITCPAGSQLSYHEGHPSSPNMDLSKEVRCPLNSPLSSGSSSPIDLPSLIS